jgi:hypothetical protein
MSRPREGKKERAYLVKIEITIRLGKGWGSTHKEIGVSS